MPNLDLSIAKIMHGDTPVLRIMEGDTRVWPSGTDVAIDGILTNVTSSVSIPGSAALNSPLTITLTPNSSHIINQISVTMGGVDITSTAYNEGVITIASVTGDIIIHASAIEVITFEDAAVKAICVSNWGGNVIQGEITPAEAAQVTSLSGKFKSNTTITAFEELRYFTKLNTLYQAFYGCNKLKRVTFPSITLTAANALTESFDSAAITEIDLSNVTASVALGGSYAFRRNSSLTKVILGQFTITGFVYGFNSCWNLTYIDAHLCTFAISGTPSGPFIGPRNCTRIIGGLPGWGATTKVDMPLTHDATVELLESLGTVTGKTLTLRAAVLNALTAEEKAIATSKGWTLAS